MKGLFPCPHLPAASLHTLNYSLTYTHTRTHTPGFHLFVKRRLSCCLLFNAAPYPSGLGGVFGVCVYVCVFLGGGGQVVSSNITSPHGPRVHV